MVWIVTLVTFVATMLLVAALSYAFSAKKVDVAGRFSQLSGVATPPLDEGRFTERQKEKVRDSLASVGKLLPDASPKQANRTQLMMIRAGYRSPEAILAMRGFRLLFPIATMTIVLLSGFYRLNPLVIPIATLGLGYLIPDILLTWRVHARQHKLRRALPDALDLLVICVEAGLGLDQALMKVSQDMRITHHELSQELQLVNLEMRIGKSRIEALRELARRTGLDDIKALVAMLIQTERFGTSIAQSLRVFSEDMRTKRRQRAEEKSAKTSVKMVPPLVFFIFPALMVIILGPAVLTLLRQLMPTIQK